MIKTALLAFVVALMPAIAFSDPARDQLCGTFGVNAWGLSFHVDHAMQYNEANWGLGLRCYARPEWSLLGQNADNKIFLQADAMLNSHRGLVLPIGGGVEYKLGSLRSRCKLFFLGAVAIAYYQTPDR